MNYMDSLQQNRFKRTALSGPLFGGKPLVYLVHSWLTCQTTIGYETGLIYR